MNSHRPSLIKSQIRNVLTLAVVALALLAVFTAPARPQNSAEVHFSDRSGHGLSIVPASCPSTPDFPGQCDGSGGLCPVGYVQQGNSCVFSSCPTYYSLIGGTCVITSCPTGYTLQKDQCVFVLCPAGQSYQDGACVTWGSCKAETQCIGNSIYTWDTTCKTTLVQACTYGCYNASCVVPPPGIATWHVQPVLVRAGSTVLVSWATQNVSSCSVTGTNADVWSAASGSETSSPIRAQTVYSITCQGFPGASPASVSDSTTVNIVPIFNEQ